MRKIYSLVLMAAMLLVGTNVWAENEIEIVRGGSTYNTYSHIEAAFKDALDGDLIRLTNDLTETFDSVAWFGETSSGTLVNYASTDRSITLDLMGHTYTLRKGNSASMIAFIIFTRGGLTIQSTGGDGVIMTPDAVDIFTITGTYLKIDAETQTPFTHLKVEQNVTLTSAKNAVCIETAVSGRETSDHWGRSYPLDYSCHFSPVSQQGVSNGVRLDIYGTLVGKKYGLKASGVLRIGREFLNEAGNYLDFIWSGSTKYTLGSTNYDKISSNSDVYYMPRGAKISENVDAPYDGYQGEYIFTLNDDPYTPYIHIYPSALLKSNDPDAKTAVGFYCSGYCRAYVEGTCEGSTGVYVKSGEVELHDATVVSNYDHEYKGAANDLSTSGVNAGGSAIVIESKTGWTGNISVTISGDTHVSTDHGYAIDEQVTSGGTHVNYLTITGGTFEGGQVPVIKNGDTIGSTTGTMFVSQPTLDANQNPDTITTITILGATVSGSNTNYIGDADNQMTLADFLGGQGNTHVTYVTDENNNVTMVISEGAAPNAKETRTTWNNIVPGVNGIVGYADSIKTIKADSIVNAKWTGTGDPDDANFESSYGYGLISTGDTVKLGELQMISGTDANNKQVLVIQNGATLDVRHLMMNSYAQIIVEAGGKLIVEGTQGIVAPSVDNIVLKSTATSQAQFLFNPEVSSNRHPNATVELTTISYWNSNDDMLDQPFGIPTGTRITDISSDRTDRVAFFAFDLANDVWNNIGSINYPNLGESNLDTSKLEDPFRYYRMICVGSTAGTKITMKGKLVGNDNQNMNYWAHYYMGFANSYTADINTAQILPTLPGANEAVYVRVLDNYGHYIWRANSLISISTPVIAPMQAFKILNRGLEANSVINYRTMVWNPAITSAPARSMAIASKLDLYVHGLRSSDYVTLIEDERYTSDIEQGEAEKLMNDDANLYVTATNPMSIFATNELDRTYLGFSCVNGGTYTIDFESIPSENLILMDMVTNASIPMVEGGSYQFEAANGEDNAYRFQIRKVQNIATDIESMNEENTIVEDGIYSITGQYIGNVHIWNTLPSGMYIVNGVKKIK